MAGSVQGQGVDTVPADHHGEIIRRRSPTPACWSPSSPRHVQEAPAHRTAAGVTGDDFTLVQGQHHLPRWGDERVRRSVTCFPGPLQRGAPLHSPLCIDRMHGMGHVSGEGGFTMYERGTELGTLAFFSTGLKAPLRLVALLHGVSTENGPFRRDEPSVSERGDHRARRRSVMVTAPTDVACTAVEGDEPGATGLFAGRGRLLGGGDHKQVLREVPRRPPRQALDDATVRTPWPCRRPPLSTRCRTNPLPTP